MGVAMKKLVVWIAVLAIVQGALSNIVVRPRYARDFAPKSTREGGQLPSELIFLQFFGFREFLAGMLWVRADEFFERGNYDAILPIIRLVTWLDPHYIDVYATGMWHLGYNFTDEESRSDRRYIPFALALGEEGAANNPTTYEMFFETGWMWFHKIDDDYHKAIEWFLRANERPDILPARRNLLAVAYQRAGQIDEALNWYFKLLRDAEERLAKHKEYTFRMNRDTIEGNVDNTLVRMAQRGHFAMQRNDGSYETGAYDTRPPFDVGFSARIMVEEPLVIRVEGTWNVLPVGTRIRMVLRDADYEFGVPAGMVWDHAKDVNLDPPTDLTFMQDSLYVKNRRFSRRIDLSKDPTMYPFSKKTYILEFYYNPRSAPAHMQDKFGWSGEGMTDRNFLDTKIREGQRVMYCKLEMTQDQILRRGEWFDRTPVIKTTNFVPPRAGASPEGEVIIVPGLRAGAAKEGGPAPTGGQGGNGGPIATGVANP